MNEGSLLGDGVCQRSRHPGRPGNTEPVPLQPLHRLPHDRPMLRPRPDKQDNAIRLDDVPNHFRGLVQQRHGRALDVDDV